MKRTIILFIALFGLAFSASAIEKGDARFTQRDVERFDEVMAAVAADRGLPMDELIVKVAKQFLGTPYVAGTLEQEPERLTVNLRETDCILFVEMCLALALTAKDDNPSVASYIDRLAALRYRDGVVCIILPNGLRRGLTTGSLRKSPRSAADLPSPRSSTLCRRILRHTSS